ELLESLRARDRCEAVAGSRDVNQLLALEVSEDQRVERLRSARVAADHELLSAIHAHLHPRARSKAGLVGAVAPLRDKSLESVGLYRLDENRQLRIEGRGVAHWLWKSRKHLLLE